jgi:hypothetical protein
MALNLQDPYLVYYKNQLGSGVSVVYRGAPYQRGHGIGSFLGGLFRTITPLLKSGAKAVGKEALKTGINVLQDVMGTVPPNQALANRMKEFTGNLKRRADDKLDNVMMRGSGASSYKKRKLNVTPQSLRRLLAVRPKKSVSKRKAPAAAASSKSNKNRKVKATSFKDIFG